MNVFKVVGDLRDYDGKTPVEEGSLGWDRGKTEITKRNKSLTIY